MSEDEAINILKTMCTDNFCIEQLKSKQAIETILDLYKQEKEKNKILTKIISLVRKETRLVRFALGKPYNTPKKEIFLKFINIQQLVKGNYPFLRTEEYIDDLLKRNSFIKR